MAKDKAKTVKKPKKKAEPKGPKGTEQAFRIDDIKFDDEMQPRVGGLTMGYKQGELGFQVVDEHVNAIAGAVKAGEPIRRVEIWRVAGKGNFLTDGHHTVLAHFREGRKTVPATVYEGSYEDAKLAASAANKDHDKSPLKRTHDDKRKAVEMALLSIRAKGEDWTDSRVAKHVGVGDDLVKKMRLRLPKAKEDDSLTNRPEGKGRESADGRIYKKKPGRKPKAATVVTESDPKTEPVPAPVAVPAKPAEFDIKDFESKVGVMEREVDVLANVYEAKNDPRVAQVRQLLREFKAEVLDVNKNLLKKRAEKQK